MNRKNSTVDEKRFLQVCDILSVDLYERVLKYMAERQAEEELLKLAAETAAKLETERRRIQSDAEKQEIREARKRVAEKSKKRDAHHETNYHRDVETTPRPDGAHTRFLSLTVARSESGRRIEGEHARSISLPSGVSETTHRSQSNTPLGALQIFEIDDYVSIESPRPRSPPQLLESETWTPPPSQSRSTVFDDSTVRQPRHTRATSDTSDPFAVWMPSEFLQEDDADRSEHLPISLGTFAFSSTFQPCLCLSR